MNFILFLFSFNLRLGFSVTLYVNITNCHVSAICHEHIITYCCGDHLSQRQIISQAVNLLSWISSGKFTRELDKEPLLN